MDKTKQWGLAAGVAVLAVLVGGWFLLISPQRSEASDLRAQTDTQESANQQLQSRIAALQSQHKDLPQVQAKLAELAQQLPANPALPALIRQLSNAADSAGVNLVSLSPTEPQVVTEPAALVAPTTDTSSAASDAGTTTAAPAPAPQLAYVPIDVVVNGSYYNVAQFVSNLEANRRVFLVTQVDSAPAAPEAASGSTAGATTSGSEYDGFLEATISGRVFMDISSATSPALNSTATAAAK